MPPQKIYINMRNVCDARFKAIIVGLYIVKDDHKIQRESVCVTWI